MHQELPQRMMTFLELLLELMMTLMFLTGAGVLDDVMDGLQSAYTLRELCLKFG